MCVPVGTCARSSPLPSGQQTPKSTKFSNLQPCADEAPEMCLPISIALGLSHTIK